MKTAEKIKTLRLEKGLTQKELAAKMGCHPSQVSHYERGRRVPKIPNLMRLAKALDTTLDYLCE